MARVLVWEELQAKILQASRWVQVQRDGALAESFPVGLEPQVEAYASFETPFDILASPKYSLLTFSRLSHLLHHFL